MTKPFEHLTQSGLTQPEVTQGWIDSKKVEAAISATKSVEQRVLDSLERIEKLLEKVARNTWKRDGRTGPG